jgi:uncharacterized protein
VPHDFDTSILEHVSHRPWPMPGAPWVMTQTWHDLLFAHWPVDSQILQSRIPSAFELDLFDGSAWIGLVPFHMTNVAPRGLPSLPRISEFPELNLRTYVRISDRPGVYFFSLDAASRLAVRTAQLVLNLPYFTAMMSVTPRGGRIAYESHRKSASPVAQVELTYEPTGTVSSAKRGSLEYFLIERYCLYNVGHRGRPYRLDIHHPPWALQTAKADFSQNTIADAVGIPLPSVPPLLHFVKRQDMVAWWPRTVAAPRPRVSSSS